MFERHSLEINRNGYTAILYLDPNLTEFADELINSNTSNNGNLIDSIHNYIKENLNGIKVNAVKLMIGSILVTTIPFGVSQVFAEETTSSQIINQQSTSYSVVTGDTLWSISNKLGVSINDIKTTNNLSSDMIYIGQILKIPVKTNVSNDYTTYSVLSGDTLYKISQRFNTNVDSIKKLNNLTSDMIYIGQVLKIPAVQPPANDSTANASTHTVAAGDTLWLISQKTGVSIDKIKQLNNLTSNTIYIGQVLKIADTATNPEKPWISYTSHKVVQGENSWTISLLYGIPMSELLQVNNLTQNSVLSIGQTLKIPVHNIPIKPTLGSMYGEALDWWTEAQYVIPIGKECKVTDFRTGKTFVIKRTVGAFHADCEPLTASDSAIIKELWGGNYSWIPRAVVVEVDGRKIAASMASMPHDIQYIIDNDFDGHFDLHFLNSTRHKDGLQDPAHQEQVRIAAGLSAQ